MLFKIEKLIGMPIHASDGTLGKVTNVFFDDHRWVIRYLVVDTGSWLEDRKVLISPLSVTGVDWVERSVHVRLTLSQVKASPDVETDKPVSRQRETELIRYYGYPDYLVGPMMWGITPFPLTPSAALSPSPSAPFHPARPPADHHLRSLNEVHGYHLHATDGGIGHLQDFLIDPKSWAIRFIVIDTRKWLPGRQVLIPPQWVINLDWDQKNLYVDVTHDEVKHSPEYDPGVEFSSVHEDSLYGHYRHKQYGKPVGVV
jgi:sporulation protein YlmC with PRC-barrel domain